MVFLLTQRRLSDPSANLNNFVRGGWKTKPYETTGAKSRSENEGLDSMANGLAEIEAGDVRDGKKQRFVYLCFSGLDRSISTANWS
jgi:hypothetical protein